MNKLTHLFPALLLLLPYLSYGQTDTTYFDEDWKGTDKYNATYYRVVQLQTDKKYKVEDHYLNNDYQMKGYYLSAIPTLDSALRDGPFVYYDKKGNKTSEGNYKNDKADGEWKYYYDDSKNVWYKLNYTDGEENGELISYYKSGKIKRRQQLRPNDTAKVGKCYDEQGREIKFTPFRIMPRPGYVINDFLSGNLTYPHKAQEKNIEGRVKVKFVVNEDGSISDVTATNHVGGGCDEEAIRVVALMPKWQPGILDDKIVKIYYTLPIVFKLED